MASDGHLASERAGADFRPPVTVIIPVRRVNDFVRELVPQLLGLDYPGLKVMVLPDVASAGDGLREDARLHVVPTGSIGPGEKRDRGAALTAGGILAFLDDDGYPSPRWLDT